MTDMDPLSVTASVIAYATQTYGGFWIRVVAWIIDAFVISIISVPLAMIFGLSRPFGGRVGFHPLLFFTFISWRLVIVWLYEALMTSSQYQATLGKMILGLRVTDLAGRRISFARATARAFGKVLSGMILGIGYLMVAFTERKQGLHDMLAGTLVQKTR